MRVATGHCRSTSVGAALLALAVACGDPGPAQPNLTFAPDALPGAQLGRSYSVTISVSGNETPVFSLQVERGSLPPGLSLTHQAVLSVGVLEGTPTQAGSFAFSIRAICFGTNRPGQEGIKDYLLVVQ
jgi:hypothetical protein